MNGNQVIAQTKIRPVRSLVGTAPNSNGVGIQYGMGAGAVRIGGITYSVYDASGQYVIADGDFIARIVVINGDYPLDATQFQLGTDLTNFVLLYDRLVSKSGDTLPVWFSGMATDDGENATLLISQIVFPAGGFAGVLPVSTIILHADRYESRELALSQGSIFER